MPSSTARPCWLGLALLGALSVSARAGDLPPLSIGAHAWRDSRAQAIRGLTVGPIESAHHPDRGYGSEVCQTAMLSARAFGANWVSITPFGRVYDLSPTGVALSYEATFRDNRQAVTRAIEQAHAAGLKVMLVPHLWVETGDWRGFIDPGADEDWDVWSAGYQKFVSEWAKVARDTKAEMLVVGVELRRWVTTDRAPSFLGVIRSVREVYPGLLTYAANWDDVHDTVIWGELDLIGINAFFPLAKQKQASASELSAEAARVAVELAELAELWQRPILFTEFGYTTRDDPALEPWLWPEHLHGVKPNELAQAQAYRALLAAVVDQPWFAGGFVWRVFADPYDLSQEPEWGFSPRFKLAELVLQDAFAARWASDGRPSLATSWSRVSADRPKLVGVGH